MTTSTSWAITTGEQGMRSQVVGLAEAVGLPYEEKLITVVPPWNWLSGRLSFGVRWGARCDGKMLSPPWPELLITCGRRSVGTSLAIKRLSKGKTFTVHIQNPLAPPSLFDMVVCPEHDQLKGKNVVSTLGAVHHITKKKLTAAKRQFTTRYGDLKKPVIALLVGGSTRHYHITQGIVHDMAQLMKTIDASIIITPSRRTDDKVIGALHHYFKGPNVDIWDRQGTNPYLPMLAGADAIIASCDSISMVSEACFTGKPVYVWELPGKGSRRFDIFYKSLYKRGAARPFEGTIDNWSHQPLDETKRVATLIKEQMRG